MRTWWITPTGTQHCFSSFNHHHLLPSGHNGCWGDYYTTKPLTLILSSFTFRCLFLPVLWGSTLFLSYAGCMSIVPRVQCYQRTVIVLSDHPRWMFKKNSMEFFVVLGYYLYYSTVAILLWVHNRMSFQNVLWSPDFVTWYDYLSSHTIYILTPLYDLRL